MSENFPFGWRESNSRLRQMVGTGGKKFSFSSAVQHKLKTKLRWNSNYISPTTNPSCCFISKTFSVFLPLLVKTKLNDTRDEGVEGKKDGCVRYCGDFEKVLLTEKRKRTFSLWMKFNLWFLCFWHDARAISAGMKKGLSDFSNFPFVLSQISSHTQQSKSIILNTSDICRRLIMVSHKFL